MKKNIFKKIVASLATAAMAVGMFAAMPADEAKADTREVTETEWSIKGTFTDNWATPVAMTSDGNGNFTYSAEVAAGDHQFCLFSGDIYVNEQNYDKAGTSNFTFSLTEAKNVTITFKTAEAKDNFWGSYYVEMDVLAVYLTIGEAQATPAQLVTEKIDAALAKEVSIANQATYQAALDAYNALKDAEKGNVEAAKVSSLKAAVTKINELVAAEDAKNAGKLTIYVKTPQDWDEVAVYGWYYDNSKAFGEWPGTKLTALEKNTGWYSCSFDITKAVSIIFNNNNGGEQTVNWENISAGTYYMVLSDKADNGQYKVDNVSTKQPSDWKDENAQEVTTQPATTTKPADKTETPDTGDSSTAIIMLAVAAVAAGAVVVSRKRAVNE